MAPAAAKHNLSLVPLASPTSGLERIQQAEPSRSVVVLVWSKLRSILASGYVKIAIENGHL